ncbi:MAG: MFS transporter, partial [Burkholderiaceae bacterium]|nr:MFS transporter [Burkholderiaceae bacterium]
AGRWLDAAGARAPLAAAAALLAAGVALPAAFPYERADLGPLLAGAALIGTGAMLTQMTVQDLIGRAALPHARTAAFSWFALGISAASFGGPVAAGLLIDGLGHRAAFGALLGVALALAALLASHWHRLPVRDGASTDGSARPFFDLLRYPRVRDVLLATALISMSWDLQTFLVPVHGTQAGLSATQIGLVFGAFALATFAVRAAMPWLSRTLREWQVLTFTLCTAALAFALMPLAVAPLPLAACAALLGLGLGAAQPNVMSLLHARAPAGRIGEALGLRTTIMNGSHVVLPLAFGAAGSVSGPAPVFWLMAGVLAAGGLFAARRAQASA